MYSATVSPCVEMPRCHLWWKLYYRDYFVLWSFGVWNQHVFCYCVSGRGIVNMSSLAPQGVGSTICLLLRSPWTCNHQSIFCYRISWRGITMMSSATESLGVESSRCILQEHASYSLEKHSVTSGYGVRKQPWKELRGKNILRCWWNISLPKLEYILEKKDVHRNFALFFCQMSNSYLKPWTVSRPEKVYVGTWKLISLCVFQSIILIETTQNAWISIIRQYSSSSNNLSSLTFNWT